MSIQTQIDRLNLSKTNIKNEMAKLGIIIPNTVKIDEYYNYINQYILDFNSRLAELEKNSQEALYFDGSVTVNSNSVEGRLHTEEELQELKLYIKE